MTMDDLLATTAIGNHWNKLSPSGMFRTMKYPFWAGSRRLKVIGHFAQPTQRLNLKLHAAVPESRRLGQSELSTNSWEFSVDKSALSRHRPDGYW
jgi:hypothetical protein